LRFCFLGYGDCFFSLFSLAMADALLFFYQG